MKLRIAQFAPLTESVPPKGYGGTELVASLLTEQLVQRGHDVTLFASGDSITKAKLVSVCDRALRLATEIPMRRWQAYDQRALLKIKSMAGQYDIIHNHMGWQALPFLDQLDVPVVSTNHNPVKDYCLDIYLTYKHMPYISISNAYCRLNHPDELNYVATVYNGIDLDLYETSELKDPADRQYLVFLGRICQDKGTAEAIRVARALKRTLKIAGKVDPADEAYYQEQVAPHLGDFGDYKIEYIGEVDDQQKKALLANAIATIYPIDFEEPFGLVMAESMASGTPVVAFKRGSVPELIEDGVTGLVVETEAQMVERFPEVLSIKARDCVERVRKNFSKEAMTDAYEAVYQKLVGAAPKQNEKSNVYARANK